jgi:predicted ATPase
MSAAPPRTLGHYVIENELGRGGMGVVYLARDLRLGRLVAIKTLPAGVASDPEQLSRFEREAKLLASLNHPNIATIHGLEEADDSTRYLILEFVDGQTLAGRLSGGALPFEEAVQVCKQVADALEAAHERGVIHRDLKPQNVMIVPGGRVKVLDFGLAKRSVGEGAANPETSMVTVAGMMMGTPGYMSPEQVLAQPQDNRTDVFAFGCVLYECLTARRVFDAGTLPGMIAAVLSADPDWSVLPTAAPAGVRDLLAACLQKDPDRRPAAIGEVRNTLVRLLREHESGEGRTISALTGALHNLPREVTSFVGREVELAECRALLEQTHFLTMTGAGGSGKTRLALRLVSGMVERYPGGVWFVDLAPVAESARVPQVVAAALAVREEPGRPLEQTLIARLKVQKTLLVLDNCEHVIQACARLVQSLLHASDQLSVVATSREALGVVGEQIFSVPTLSAPVYRRRIGAEAAATYASVRLFVERAAQVQPGFQLTDESAGAIAEICRRLDGIPLAIELAAARIKVLAVDQIRAKLDDRFRLLTGGSRTAVPRQQTLRATIQWSYDQLHADEQRLMRALGVFAGGWTLEGAAAVSGPSEDEFDVLDLLTRLVDKSLVVVERPRIGDPRYRYLETVREYALEKLTEAQESEPVRDRHIGFYLGVAERAEGELMGPQQSAWLHRLDAEHENLIAAASWRELPEGEPESALRLGGAVWRYWMFRGHLGLGRRVLGQLLKAPVSSVGARGKALYGHAALALYQGDHTAAKQDFQESLAAYQAAGDPGRVADALGGLGAVAVHQRDYGAAHECYERSLALARELGDRHRMAHHLNNLGVVCLRRDDLGAARALFEEARDLLRQMGDSTSLALSLQNLAMLSGRSRDIHALRGYLIEGLDLLQEMGSQQPLAVALESSAELAMLRQEPLQVAMLLGAAETLRSAIEMPPEPGQAEELARLRAWAEQASDPKAFEEAWSRGASWSFETAITEALTWLKGISPAEPAAETRSSS